MLGIWRGGPPARGASFVVDPSATGQFVYGCASAANACVWFPKGHNRIAGEITGLNDPQGIGVNPANGDVYIANTGGSDIKVYAPNSTTLVADYQDPGQFPVDVAVDTRGNFFVANIFTTSGSPGSVTVYDSSGNLKRTLTDPNVSGGISVAVDEFRLLTFCFNNTSGEGECDDFKFARDPGTVHARGWGFTGGSSYDAAEHLVVIDQLAASALGFIGIAKCGSLTLNGVGDPVMMALDAGNRTLYTGDAENGGILAYPFTDCGNAAVSPSKIYNKGLGASSLVIGAAVTPGVHP